MRKILFTLITVFCIGSLAGCQEMEEYNKLMDEVSNPPVVEKEEPKKEVIPDILTIDNCPELKTVLYSKDATVDDYKAFFNKYKYKEIEIDAYVGDLQKRESYNTYNILFRVDDVTGPNFIWENAGITGWPLENGAWKLGVKARIKGTIFPYKEDTDTVDISLSSAKIQ